MRLSRSNLHSPTQPQQRESDEVEKRKSELAIALRRARRARATATALAVTGLLAIPAGIVSGLHAGSVVRADDHASSFYEARATSDLTSALLARNTAAMTATIEAMGYNVAMDTPKVAHLIASQVVTKVENGAPMPVPVRNFLLHFGDGALQNDIKYQKQSDQTTIFGYGAIAGVIGGLGLEMFALSKSRGVTFYQSKAIQASAKLKEARAEVTATT